MSTSRPPSLSRFDRTPLRDVQNEILAVQQCVKTTSIHKNTSTNYSSHMDSNVCVSEENSDSSNDQDVTFKSFYCTGEEVEVYSGSATINPEDSLLRALTPKDDSQVHNGTVMEEETEILNQDSEHAEHPYCRVITDQPPPLDLTFKSFTCSGGEIEITSESLLQDNLVIAKNSDLPQTPENETAEAISSLYPYSHDPTGASAFNPKQTDDQDATSSTTEFNADISFKSFVCSGSENQVTNDVYLAARSKTSENEIPEMFVRQHSDHPYCQPLTDEHRDGFNVTQDLNTNDETGCENAVAVELFCTQELSISNDPVLTPKHLESQTESISSEKYSKEICNSLYPLSTSQPAADLTGKHLSYPADHQITRKSIICNNPELESEDIKETAVLQNETDGRINFSSMEDVHEDVVEHQGSRNVGLAVDIQCFSSTSPHSLHLVKQHSSVMEKSTDVTLNNTGDGTVSNLPSPNSSGQINFGDDQTFFFPGAEIELEDPPEMTEVSTLIKNLHVCSPAQSLRELSVNDGDVVVDDKNDHLYCHVVSKDDLTNDSALEVLSGDRAQCSFSAAAQISQSVLKHETLNNELQLTEFAKKLEFSENFSIDAEHCVQSEEQNPDCFSCPDELIQSSNTEENVYRDRKVVDCHNTTKGDIIGVCEDDAPAGVTNSEYLTSKLVNLVTQDLLPQSTSVPDHAEIQRAESVDLQTQMKIWSEIILSEPPTPERLALGQLWLPESPIPPPQLNSTELNATLTPARAPMEVKISDDKNRRATMDFSAVGKGPLQQQLRKMAELLIAASGKITASTVVTPVKQRSALVGTSPILQRECSTNTSALLPEKKEMEVTDACTSTDSLLWSVNRNNLGCLSRAELEQKLISTLIMVEILSQQLTSTQNPSGRTGASPSNLRDRLVQTEQTEFSQMDSYRELYFTALKQIQTLEHDQETLHCLHQAMQLTQTSMINIKSETQDMLFSMKQLEGLVNEDHQLVSKQGNQVKALYARCMDTLRKMEHKNSVCLKERDDMKRRMEEALEEKALVFQVLEQLRSHHSSQISNLQQTLGSHLELSASLTNTYPQLVALNKMFVESLNAANVLLKENLEDHMHLSTELFKAQQLLQKANPLLHKLQHRASAAIKQSKQHQEERDRANEDRVQVMQQLYEAHSNLQEADQQIKDLNTQITIMNTEMAVLREQLGEVEEERDHLQRQATELSATVSSTIASYTFLEQALASETNKLQQSLHESHLATERADSLQSALHASVQQVKDLEEVLLEKESILSVLTVKEENQRQQLCGIPQIQNELANACEMNEFLQAEYKLTQEQLFESEGLLRSHLQGLRQRNLECEDLRVELHQLREERDRLKLELLSTQDKARLMLLDQGEQFAQATLDASLLLQRICALIKTTCTTTTTTADSNNKSCEPSGPQLCNSFVTTVIQALTEEQPCITATASDPDEEPLVEKEDLIESIGSNSSAFTRIAPTAPQNTDDIHGSSTLIGLLFSVGERVSELTSTIEQLRLCKDSEIQNLHVTTLDLQKALETQSNQHRAEGKELKQLVDRLKAQAEKDAQALLLKSQDEKALNKLCSELEEKVAFSQKHRAENNDLRREVADLRQALQQSRVEVHALREALNKENGPTKNLDEKINLLKEVEKLKSNLWETEESKTKLMERAKRHQRVHAINQSKLERELHLLDDMIESVRKTLSSVPDVVKSCPELQSLVEFLG